MRKILIDGDGCPVVDESIEIARRFDFMPIIFCDTAHLYQREGVDTIVVSKGSDAVDFVLVNKVEKEDIVVTQDYGLAAMVLSKKGYPISQNGMIYTTENIDRLLFTRYVSKKIRNSGGRVKGPKKRTKADNELFIEQLSNLCKKILKAGK